MVEIKKETEMGSNVDKIVGDIIERFRPLVREAVQKADADARGELLAQFSKAIGGANGSAKAPVAASGVPVKRKVGRPRKNPLPETVLAAPAAKPKKAKAKRVVSDEVRQKLADNLKKAREAKSDKVKPVAAAKATTTVKRKPGRPRKVQPETAAAPVA
jgi:hypothetical protein